ncbi:M12 family metallopeptidase [Coleofasciculus chthonoplastes]|uniref:M12 family metallopeptidase n=1 Tax=Coleofasciculus chthonoplastes TaxID=64178 RepID=UPI0032FCA0D9
MNQISKPKVDLVGSVDEHMATSEETGRGYLTGPGLYEFPVDYVVVDGVCIHEGCIDIGSPEEVKAEAERIRAKHLRQQTTEAAGSEDVTNEPEVQRGIGLPTTSSFLWTNGVVPYTIASNVPDPNRVDDAVRYIEEMTALRLVRRTAANAQRYPNYIEIISNGNKGWSSSAIGMRGGRQVIRYSDRHTWSILVHEFLHAFGVYHEQSRSDRDDFVEIRWNNIQDNNIGNFQKKPGSVDYFGYDYGSIMHYRGTSFAKDPSQPTIVPLQSGVTIGQRSGMSYGDRQTIAKMYQRFFSRGYAGVWRSGTGRYALWINASWQSFRDKWQTWSSQGLRLQDIHVRRRGSQTLYSGVFRPGSGAYGLWANVTWDSFKAKWQEWSQQGLRLVDIHVHRVGDQNRYSGVFLPGSGAYGLWVNVTWDSFKAKWQEWSQQGLRLVDIHVHRVGSQNRYSGVFLPGRGGYGLWVNATWSSFFSKWQELTDQGLRLVDLNMHQVGNSIRYSGVFLPGNDDHYLWANVTFESLRAKWQELAAQGLRLVDFEITNPEDGAADFADISLEGGDVSYSSREQEGFGGIFEPAALNDVADFSQVLQESGGGMGNSNGAEVAHKADQDGETNGGVFFPDSNVKLSNEQEGLGGAFFNVEPDQSTTESEGYGEVILPD